MLRSLTLMALMLISLNAVAQIDPVDQDPDVGFYTVKGPAGSPNTQGNVHGPTSTGSPSPGFGVVANVTAGNYELELSSQLQSGTVPFSVAVGKTTEIEFPAVALCGTFYQTNNDTLRVDFLNVRPALSITSSNPNENLKLGFPAVNPLSVCRDRPYATMPGTFSVSLNFDSRDPLTPYLPAFKPVNFTVAAKGLTAVAFEEEDLRSQVTSEQTGKASFPLMQTNYQGVCAYMVGAAQRHEKFFYVNSKPEIIDLSKPSPILTQAREMNPGTTYKVWPLSSGAPLKYFASVSGLQQEIPVQQSGITQTIETKLVNINDVFVKTTIPGKVDYYVPGKVKINLAEPTTKKALQTVQYQTYDTYKNNTRSCDYGVSLLLRGSTSELTTKKSYELLAGFYQVEIKYYHPEENRMKQQNWDLDCTVSKANCTGRMVSEGPI